MKLWQRHIFSRLIRTFLFIISCFFLLYILVDLSVHADRFLRAQITPLTLYYLQTFSLYLDTFFSLAFLMSALKVLFELNYSRELVALQMAGLSKKKLLSPFFSTAAIIAIISYLNAQYVIPTVQDDIYTFRKPHKKEKQLHLHSFTLEDDSEIVCQKMDKTELFDVFWIRTPDDIWHMKTLVITDPPVGYLADHLKRNVSNQLEKMESFVIKQFPDLQWKPHSSLPLKSRPLSQLFSAACSPSSERSSIFAHLSYKLAVPLAPLLLLFAITPFTTRFSRKGPFFLIASCSLFASFGIKIILDGMLVLGENQVLNPLIAIWGPFIMILIYPLYRYARMQ